MAKNFFSILETNQSKIPWTAGAFSGSKSNRKKNEKKRDQFTWSLTPKKNPHETSLNNKNYIISRMPLISWPWPKGKFKISRVFSRSKSNKNKLFRLFPILSISQKFFSIFFLTLEKIGIDEKVICYHNISN